MSSSFHSPSQLGLAALALGRLNEMSEGLNVFSNGLNKYVHEWISVFGLNKNFSD